MGSKWTLSFMAAAVKCDPAVLKSILEYEFNTAIVLYAKQQLWKVHYERRSGHMGKDANGNPVWRGSGPEGWPDLFMVRLHQDQAKAVAYELKTESGRATPEQEEWLARLGRVPGVTAKLVRPRDAQSIMDMLGPA